MKSRRSEPAQLHGVGQTVRRGNYRVKRIVRPTEVLPTDVQDRIFTMIREDSNVMFNNDMTAYWSARPDYFSDLTEMWIAFEGDRFTGWSGISTWESELGSIVYMDSLGVLPDARRSGLGVLLMLDPLLRFVVRKGRLPWVSLRTESPVIFSMFRRFVTSNAYPRVALGRAKPPSDVRRVAEYTARRKSPGKQLKPETLVIPGALDYVETSLYGSSVPLCGDEDINTFFSSQLNPIMGDSIIGVGVPDTEMLRTVIQSYAFMRARITRATWLRRRGDVSQ